jgi:hypothetical protein
MGRQAAYGHVTGDFMVRTGLAVAAAVLTVTLAAGCETDSDWVAAYPGRLDCLPTQHHLAECAGQNGPQWKHLDSAPPKAEEYLRRPEAAAQPNEVGRKDTWYTRKPGEVLLCRSVYDAANGGYSAFWHFREKDGEVIVAESYAWQYVMVN